MTSRSDSVAPLHPASFALVMATGIVSIACQLLGLPWLATPLVWANVIFYAALWSLTIERAVRFPGRLMADLSHHGRAVGFFTTVAATCVLGSQAVVIENSWRVGVALWMLGIALWAIVTYTVFTLLTVAEGAKLDYEAAKSQLGGD